MNTPQLIAMAHHMRRKMLDISYQCKLSTHLGGGLSIVDILATLYGAVLRVDATNPRWEERDRFILSKGHGVLGYFSALLAAGFISESEFATFQTNGSHLIAHPVMNLDLGIESSNGSLGHGLSLGIGLALAAKKKAQSHKVYVLMGDGAVSYTHLDVYKRQGAAVAWRLGQTSLKVLCLEQGGHMDPARYPSTRIDWELARHQDFHVSPNVRQRPEDYPINDTDSPIAIANFNAVGGSTILFSACLLYTSRCV